MVRSAIILAGGFGTRLQQIVKEVPKPMAPINDKPFLHFLFSYLKKFEIQNIILSVGYLHQSIEHYFGNHYLGMNVLYSIESNPLGTGGGLRKALSMVNGDVFILNGDTFFDVDLNQFADFHFHKKSNFSICLKRLKNFERYGTIQLKEDRIIAFKEKEAMAEGLINGGIYLTSSNIFNCSTLDAHFSLEKDFLEKELNALSIYGFESKSYFIDIGIPDDYYKACKDLPELLNT